MTDAYLINIKVNLSLYLADIQVQRPVNVIRAVRQGFVIHQAKRVRFQFDFTFIKMHHHVNAVSGALVCQQLPLLHFPSDETEEELTHLWR